MKFRPVALDVDWRWPGTPKTQRVMNGWLGKVYAALPNHFGLHTHEWLRDSSWFLVSIAAPGWVVGLRMGVRGCHVPAVVVGWNFGSIYLPWGNRLYARLLGIIPFSPRASEEGL